MNTQAEAIEPYSPEWHQARLGKFTSSEIHRLMTNETRPMTELEIVEAKKNGSKKKTIEDPAIVSTGAKTYIMECLAEILTGQTEEQGYISAEMDWGTAHELEAMTVYTQRTGRSVEMGVFIIHNERSCGTPDGIEAEAVNDVKCPKSVNHIKNMLIRTVEMFKEIHPDYYWQLVHNAHLAKKDKAVFISYDPRMRNDKLKLKALEFDIDPIDKIRMIIKIEQATAYLNELLKMLTEIE